MQVRIAAPALAVLLACGSVQAEVQFNGFLSVGAGVLDTDEARYLEYSDDVDFKSDSVFALQATAPLSDGFSVTGQIVARGQDDYEAEVEWAFLSYEINDHWKVRGGRLRTPFYMYSDFLEVGFTYPWVRPPTEVYRVAFSAVDGVDTIYTMPMGGGDFSLQAYFGRYQKDDLVAVSRTVSDVDVKNLTGIVGSFEQEAWTLRASYHQADVTQESASLDALLAALRGLPGPLAGAGRAVADDLEPRDIRARFYEAGVKYDPGQFFLVAEWTSLDFGRSIAQDSTAWFASGGLRFAERNTIYLSYAELDLQLDKGYSEPLKPFLPATAPWSRPWTAPSSPPSAIRTPGPWATATT